MACHHSLCEPVICISKWPDIRGSNIHNLSVAYFLIILFTFLIPNILPFYTNSKPSMTKLAELGVLSKVSSEWRHLGLLFGQSTSDLDNFKSKAMLDNKECCERVFDKWINDDGSLHYPLSWKELFKVLRKIGHGRTAMDIEEKLGFSPAARDLN